MSQQYRVDYKSRIKQTFEIYRVAHGLDIACYVTDYKGRIQEMWEIDLEKDLDEKVDLSTLPQSLITSLEADLREEIEFYNEQNDEECEPWSYRRILMEPYKGAI